MNGYIDVPWAQCLATGTLTVHFQCHPSLQDADPVEMKMDTIVKSHERSHILDVQRVTGFVRLQFRVPDG